MRHALIDPLPPLSDPETPDRRRIKPVLAAVCAVLAIYAILGIAEGLIARQHLLRGAREAAVAEAVVHDPLQLRDAGRRAAIRSSLARANREFAHARNDLVLWEPILSHLGWLPRYGSEIAAAPPAADISLRTTDAALQLIDGLVPALNVMQNQHASGSRLPHLAAVLAAGQSHLSRAHQDMEVAAGDLAHLPTTLGNARLDTMLRKLRSEVPKLRAASAWLALAPGLLGASHPQRYLFVWQNPAELRATGGFIGASDLLTVDGGHISHRFYGHGLPHEITWPAMPLPEAVYTPESTWLFEDSNWSPDFPLSARFERWFYGEDTGQWADGVINFLDTATPDLLRATGPVYVPSFRVWANPQNVTPLAQHFVNGTGQSSGDSATHDTKRKRFFFAVLQALLARIQHLSIDRLPAIGRAVQDMIARGELLLYHRDGEVQTAIDTAGADGTLSPGRGDYLYVVDDNRSYNKLNPYVHEVATYTATIDNTLSIEATLTLHYHVSPSPANLEGGGPNFGLWGTKHDYQDFVRVYVPLGARLESMTGLDGWAPRTAYGATQFAGRVLIREGRSDTVVIRYRIPPNILLAAGPGEYRLKIQHQPGADLQAIRVVVHGGRGVTLHGGSRSHGVIVPLDRSRNLRLAIGGSLRPRPITLPPAPAQPDPYIPFQNVRDPHHPL